MTKLLEDMLDAIDAGKPQDASVGMAKFAQWEKVLEDTFDAFHSGDLPKHKLEKFLHANGYTKEMANAEIKDQIATRNFKNETRARERKDAEK